MKHLSYLLLMGTAAASPFAAPVRLKADGQFIDTEVGHAAPWVTDWDGDGVKDLLVGQFGGGKLWIYKNIGTNKEPRLANGIVFQDGKLEGTVPTGGSIGFGPQVVDLDGDGKRDLISGSWPGELFFFKGSGGNDFAAPKMLKHQNGKIINVGGGIREDVYSITVTGNAEWKKDEKTKEPYLLLHGKKIKSKGKKLYSTGCATHVHAIDWDHDEDFDLLVGDAEGSHYLILNNGTAGKPAYGQVEKLDFKVNGDAGPVAVDWDWDGDFDLVVGDATGAVTYFENTGKAGAPAFAKGKVWIQNSTRKEDDENITPGIRAKVCVTDWNGDGKLDLLVGDVCDIKSKEAPPSSHVLKRQKEAQKRLNRINRKRYQIFDQLEKLKENEKKKRAELLKRLQETEDEAMSITHLAPIAETHGFIWFYAGK